MLELDNNIGIYNLHTMPLVRTLKRRLQKRRICANTIKMLAPVHAAAREATSIVKNMQCIQPDNLDIKAATLHYARFVMAEYRSFEN